MNDSANATVLIVDDEPNILEAIEFLLKTEGYRVLKAFNGLQALELAAAEHPEIVVLDVMMPGIDGFETATRLRKLPEMEYAKILFLTAKGALKDKENGYASGAEYYMVKPFDNDFLVSTVNEMMAYG